MKRRFTILTAALALLAIFAIPMGMKAAEGDVHDMNITQSTNLNNNASIPSIEIDAQSYSVKTVTINWRYNKAIENPVTIEVIVGDESWGTQTITGNTTADAVFEGESTIGAITINFTNNTGSGTGHGTFYVNSVKLTEGEGGGPAPTTYTVTYHANVTGIDDIEETYNEGATVTIAANTFTNAGYTFSEWNTQADGDGDPYEAGDVIENIQNDIELYAQWEQSSEMTLTFPLNSNPGGWPTTQSTTLTEYTYDLDGVDYTFALQNVKCGNGYLMVYSVGAVGLPAIEGYKLTKVVASNSGGCSTAVIVGISSSASQANYIAGGAAQTWSTQGSQYTYNLTSTDANTMYYMYVTNKNAQVTSVALTYEAVDVNAPSITASDVNITYNATSGSIAYTIENEPTPVGTLTASTTANWLTLGTVTAEAVPFTCTANDSLVSRSATVTLAYAYDNSTVTKNIIVTQGIDETLGTADNPFTVAQARAFIDGLNGGTSTEKYVSGIISQIDSYNSNYSSITYWISDDGTTTDQLEVYSGKGINGANFSSISDVELTAEVVVKGNLKKYNTTYEFDKNNELVVYNAPQHDVEAPTFSPVAGTYAEAQSVTISCATEGADIYYTLDGTDPDMNSEMYENTITVSETTTIKAVAYDGNDTPSNIATATYHINSQANPYTVTQALAFAEYQYPANGIYVHGIVSTAPESLSNGTLTYYISADGEATNQLEVYKGKDLNNESFTAVDDIQVGDIVTVYGNVIIYGTTNPVKEFAQGNYLVSFERPEPVLESYDLTVSPLNDHINAIYVFDAENQNDPLIEEGQAGTVQVLEGTDIIVSPDVEEGYVLASLTVLDSEGTSVQPEDHMSDGGYYSFTMPSGPVTISATAVEAPTPVTYNLASSIVSGKTYIISNGVDRAMGAQSGNIRSAAAVSIDDNNVATVTSADVYEFVITGSAEDGYTIYDVKDEGYLYASSSSSNVIGTRDENSDANSVWTIDFEESAVTISANGINTRNHIRYNYNNGNDRFSCYASSSSLQDPLYLFVKDETPITETYDLPIDGYTAENNGWNLIASPVATTPDQVENMTSNTYDLYYYDSNQENEWVNYKQDENNFNPGFELVPGKGYLYANSSEVTLKFSGDLYNGDGVITLENAGFNLVGNPYTVSATVDREFYVMVQTEEGSKIMLADDNTVTKMQGIFVEAEEEGETVMFTPASKNNANNGQDAAMVMNIIQNRGSLLDRAIIRFGEGRSMSKFQLFENGSKLYIPQNGKDYAVVSASEMGEMPVSFKANENGQYTLTVNAEGVEMNYLHLIDNMTGADIDLLQTPSYSFKANTTDYESRFRLVFSANNDSEDNFAYFNGSEWVVNGNGTLQVIDVMGRILSSQNVDGSANVNAAPGVYMIRLINGENVKTQKVVVR